MSNPACPRCNRIMYFDIGDSSTNEKRWYCYNCSKSVYIEPEDRENIELNIPKIKTSWRNLSTNKQNHVKSKPIYNSTMSIEQIIASREFGRKAAERFLKEIGWI